MPRPLALLALSAALATAGCGNSESGAQDPDVGPQVKDSGQAHVLADPTFRRDVAALGVPSGGPPVVLGHRLGARLRAIVTDCGRLDPGAFRAPYRHRLERLGRISVDAFTNRYGAGPAPLAHRTGSVVATLDLGLNEGADPRPTLAKAVLAGFGTANGPRPDPAHAIIAVRERINGLLPAEGPVDCLAAYQLSYADRRAALAGR